MINTSALKKFTASLREIPRVVAQKVATAAAPAITAAAIETFEAGETPYGVPWAPGADGQRVTLHKSGALEAGVKYVAIGTKLRVVLPTSYAKYQVGKRPVTPRQGDDLPSAYVKALATSAAEVLNAELKS